MYICICEHRLAKTNKNYNFWFFFRVVFMLCVAGVRKKKMSAPARLGPFPAATLTIPPSRPGSLSAPVTLRGSRGGALSTLELDPVYSTLREAAARRVRTDASAAAGQLSNHCTTTTTLTITTSRPTLNL